MRSLKIKIKQDESNCKNHSNHELGHSIDFVNSFVISLYPEKDMTKRKIAESLCTSISQQQQQVMERNIN